MIIVFNNEKSPPMSGLFSFNNVWAPTGFQINYWARNKYS